MTALLLELEFACCHCSGYIGVSLRCEGAGLTSENRVARGRVPCPHCCDVNMIVFNVDGTLYSVNRERRTRLRLPRLCPN